MPVAQLVFSGWADAVWKIALMTLIGSAVVLLVPAVFGFSPWKAAKRNWFFAVPFELIAAVVFCTVNYANKTAVGMVLWHVVRIVITMFMIGFNNKLFAAFGRKKVFSVLNTLLGNLLAQIVLYYTCAVWF